MEDHEPDMTETQLRQDVAKAWRTLMKDLEAEPKEIIIEGDEQGDLSDETVADVTAWLFRRRDDNGSTGS